MESFDVMIWMYNDKYLYLQFSISKAGELYAV